MRLRRSMFFTLTIAVSSFIWTALPTAQSAANWLTRVNLYRSTALLPPVTENTVFSAGALKHGRYIVKTDTLEHSEDPASPYYTPEGAAAAASSDLAASYSATVTEDWTIDLWMQAPFHAVGILDPKLRTTGYGLYHEADGSYQSGSALDVLRGRSSVPTGVTFPVAWPGNGSTVPITSYRTEYPSPLTSCPGYVAPAGLPIILQLGTGSITPSITAHSITSNGVALEHCIFHEGTYANSVPAEQSLGRSILAARDAIVLIPRAPLTTGSTYQVSITTNGSNVSWSFSVNALQGCSFGVSPTSASVAASGGTGNLTVTTDTGCGWTATSNANWITVPTGTSGNSTGVVGYSLAPNTQTTTRTGTMNVADKTVTFTQAPTPAPACSYSLSATGGIFSSASGPGSVGVTTAGGCTWTATSNANWITVNSGTNGNGNGAVGYTVAANTTTAPRNTALTIAGKTYTVSQAGVVLAAAGAFSDDFFRPTDSTVLGHGWTEVLGDLQTQAGILTNVSQTSYEMALAPSSGAILSGGADFAFSQHQGTPRFGIVLRYQDAKNYYLAYRQAGGSSVLRISKFVNGVETVLKTATLANPAKDAFFRIDASANGPTLTMSLNGALKLTVADSTYPTGGVGLLMGSTLGHVHRADNFSATAQ